MYYPFLRGKKFELYSIENVNVNVFQNTLPIVEPVGAPTNAVANGSFKRLAVAKRPFILIINPQHGKISRAKVESHLLNGLLATHTGVSVGYIVVQTSTAAEVRTFLTSYPGRGKALIFRGNFTPVILDQILIEVRMNVPDVIVFESSKTSTVTQNAFAWHPHRVLLTDGFHRASRNADYQALPDTAFEADYSNYIANGWQGIGDYQTVGDIFREKGGQPYVVTLHVTSNVVSGVQTNHYSSHSKSTIEGHAPEKFTEALNKLVACPKITPLNSTGLDMYRDWHARGHFPQLGAAKQASLQHHFELMSSLV
ncbi:MAG: sce7725 family protein [Chitinophagaceae bacterium]